MKKILIITFLFVALCFAAIQFLAVPKAKNHIENYFTASGFKNFEAKNINLSFSGLSIDTVKLDKDGFNTAELVKADISWPTYIFKPEIKAITIGQLKISSVVNSPKDLLAYKSFLNRNRVTSFIKNNINIKRITWDIATPKNALRVEGQLQSTKENDSYNFKGNFNASQHELTFQSKWSGHLNEADDLSIEGLYEGLNINTKLVALNRAIGWLNLNTTSNKTTVNAQMDAGKGSLLNIPMKNINLLLNQDGTSYPVLVRATGSGIDGVNLYGDFNFSNDIKHQSFETLLELKDPNRFINFLKQQNVLKTSSGSYPSDPTKLAFQYQPENRFASGPFPFTVKMTQNPKNVLSGTFLVYPNNLDVRGTAQGDKGMISLLQTLFHIDNKNKSDTNLRIDQNLKDLF